MDTLEDYRRKYPHLPLGTLVNRYLKKTVLGKRRAQLVQTHPYFVSRHFRGPLHMVESLRCDEFETEGPAKPFREVVGWLDSYGSFVELPEPVTSCALCEHQMTCALEGRATSVFTFTQRSQWPQVS